MDKHTTKPLVSFVIIAYNDERHIADAIKSVRAQTLQDIEIICVNDGSTDSTLQKMQEAAATDERITVLNQPNSGIFAARRAGARRAKGDYIMFLDSDDLLVPNAAESLYRKITQLRADVLAFGVEPFADEVNPPDKEQFLAIQNYYSPDRTLPEDRSGGALIRACFHERQISWNVVNKMYASSLLLPVFEAHDLKDINMCEDMLITMLVLQRTKHFERVNDLFYRYRIGSGMSTSSNLLLSHKAIKNSAMSYRILQYVRDNTDPVWFANEDFSIGFSAFQKYILQDVVYGLVEATPPEKKHEYLEWLKGFCSRERFCEDLLQSVFDDLLAAPEKTLSAIQRSWLTESTVSSVHTVAMYYYRLNNGGVERVMALLSDILTQAGYQVVVITDEAANPLDYELPEKVHRVVLGQEFTTAIDRSRAWKKALKDEKVDAVIYHGWMSQFYMPDSLTIKSLGIPLIVHTHGACDDTIRYTTHMIAQDEVFALSDLIVTLSDVDCSWWKALGYRSVCVANPPVFDMQSIAPFAHPGYDVLWVCRLEKYKNYEDAFAIAALVHQKLPEFRLHILGKAETDEKTQEILNQLHASGMDKFIIYDGYTSDVMPYYQNCSVLLSTSRQEAFPMRFVEAKIAGMPMVAYEISNVEFLRHPKGAVVVPQYDRNGAAEAIIKLLTDVSYWKQMSLDARQSIEECYHEPLSKTWARILDEALTPHAEPQSMASREPLEVAISRVMDSVKYITGDRMKPSQAKAIIADLRGAYDDLAENYRSIDHQLYEVVSSPSWKIGRMVTFIPRKLKALLKRN